jgi:sporulation protein YlmC with PRC-barrel domain
MTTQRARISVLALLAIAGAAAGVRADDPMTGSGSTTTTTTTTHTDDARTTAAGSMGPVEFVSADKMRGRNIYNASGDKVGDVSDLIIDRGSGRVPYLVVKTDSVLGIGGKSVVVPYRDFSWDMGKDRLVLNVADEKQLKTWPEFDRNSWTRDSRTLTRTLGKTYYGDTSRTWTPLTKSDMSGNERISGKIKSINRNMVTDAQEEVAVTITTPEGRDENVVFGPSWWVAGNTLMLTRDRPVEVNVVRLDRGGQKVAVARSASIDKQETRYYNTEGQPVWASGWSDTGAGNTDRSTAGGAGASAAMKYTAPFVLNTEIDGKKLDCRGDNCGHVEDLVVECTSGRVAFLVVDPDKGALGVGDKNRLVPWSVAYVSVDDKVRLDATKDMINSAPTIKGNYRDLGKGDEWRTVYTTYGVSPVMFTPARGGDDMDRGHGTTGHTGNGAGANGRGRGAGHGNGTGTGTGTGTGSGSGRP